MKQLIVNGEQFKADIIVKTNDSIIGYLNNRESFAFKGVADFTQFKLKDETGNLIEIPIKQNEIEILQQELSNTNAMLLEFMESMLM